MRSRSNWNLKVLVFEERGKVRSTRRKTSRSKGENQQQTQPTYGVDVRLSRTGRRELSPLRHPLLSNKG